MQGTVSEAVLFRLYLARRALEDGARRAADHVTTNGTGAD